jgi:hypothetical protein
MTSGSLTTLTTASLDADEVKLMAAVAESTITPSPCDDRLNGGMEKLEEVMAELCAVGFEQWCGDGGVRAGQSCGGDGIALHPPWLLWWGRRREWRREQIRAAAACRGDHVAPLSLTSGDTGDVQTMGGKPAQCPVGHDLN